MDLYYSTVKRFIKSYKWHSLFVKNFSKYLLIIFAPLIILSCFLYYFYKDNVINSAAEGITSTFISYQTTLNKSFDEIQKFIDVLTMDKNFKSFSRQKDFDFSSKKDVTLINDVNSLLNTYKTIISSIEKIYIYNEYNDYVISSKGTNRLSNYIEKEYIQQRFKNSEFNVQICSCSNKNNVDVVYKMQVDKSNDVLVIVTLNINNIIEELNLYFVNTFVLSVGDNIIFSKSKNIKDKPLEEISNNFNKVNFYSLDKKTVVLSNDLHYYNLCLTVKVLPQIFDSERKQIIIAAIICFLFVILISVILSYILSLQYYKSISNIAMLCQDSLYDNDIGNNEIEFINSSIIALKDKLKNTEESLTIQLLNLRESQITVLQNQINPHFVFNTLNSINAIIVDEQGYDSNAVILITKLSEMLVELINTKKFFVTILEEIEYTKKYLEIESIKHINSFDVNWNIDYAVKDCVTIKIILQPIVENALSHGVFMLPKSKRGIIDISVSKYQDLIVFNVKDNGPGFESESLIQMKTKLLNSEISTSKHIGLLNVNSRLKNVYGYKYGCFVESDSNGTLVRIIIPCEKNKLNNANRSDKITNLYNQFFT